MSKQRLRSTYQLPVMRFGRKVQNETAEMLLVNSDQRFNFRRLSQQQVGDTHLDLRLNIDTSAHTHCDPLQIVRRLLKSFSSFSSPRRKPTRWHTSPPTGEPRFPLSAHVHASALRGELQLERACVRAWAGGVRRTESGTSGLSKS